jgi:hypothetical protein
MNIKSTVKKLQDSDRYELNLKTYKEGVKATVSKEELRHLIQKLDNAIV